MGETGRGRGEKIFGYDGKKNLGEGSHLGYTKSFIKLRVLIERVLSEPKAIYYV